MIYKFTLAAIESWRAVIGLIIALTFAGIVSYITIPKEADPDIPVPFIYIGVTLSGLSPEDGERLIAKPIELELQQLTGLKEVTTISQQNSVGAIARFDVNFNSDKALADIREKVNMVKSRFPQEADEPVILEFNASLFPVLVVNLSGNVPERTLYRHARALKDEIANLPNVLEANLRGFREEVLEIIIDPVKLETYEISSTQLISMLNSNNQLIPAGSLDNEGGRFAIDISGLIETADDVLNLPVKRDGEAIIRIKDIAELRRSFKDATSYARFNGKPVIAIEVSKRIGENILDTTADIRRITDNFTANWDENIKVDYSSDFSTYIENMITSLELSITNAIILVMILVIATLGLRSALLVGMAIPISFVVSFFILVVFGYTLNIVIMFGLILSVGILVDGAIVIVEYADRKMAEGLERKQAYAMATQRMFLPVLSSTATTLAAFAPLLFWPGIPGKFMSYLPITVTIILCVALATTMVFIPVLGGLFGKTMQANSSISTALTAESDQNILELDGWTGRYIRFLNKCIQSPFITIIGAIIVVFSVFMFYISANKGTEFFTGAEPDQANVYIKAQGNISTAQADRLTRKVEDIILATPGIKYAFTRAGASTSINPDIPADMIGQIRIEFSPYNTRKPARQIIDDIHRKANKVAGIRVEIQEREDGPPQGKNLEVEIRGFDFDDIEKEAQNLNAFLSDRSDLFVDIDNSLPLPGIKWEFITNREKAGFYDADIETLGGVTQLVTNGLLVARYRPDDSDDEIDIRARLPESDRTIDKLDDLRVMTNAGLVPASNFLTRLPRARLDEITRVDGLRTITFRANTAINPDTGEKYLTSDATAAFSTWFENNTPTPGVFMLLRGNNEDQVESITFLTRAALASLFIMFIILLLQFNSLYYTILTLSTIIFSTIGVLLGLVLTQQTFSVIMTGTGIVALAGIIVNNSIVLIDTYQRLLKTGLDRYTAILRTAGQRLRPILLTTTTTIIGLLPMAIGATINIIEPSVEFSNPDAAMWLQLSNAIIFGLGFSTLLTLILVPVLLVLPEHLKALFSKLVKDMPILSRFSRFASDQNSIGRSS